MALSMLTWSWSQILLEDDRVKVVCTRFTRKGNTILTLKSGKGMRPGDFAAKVGEVLRDDA